MRRDDSAAPSESGTLPTPVATGSVASIDPHQWVDQHGDYLFRYALIRLRNETAAEGLVQETLLSAFKSTERYDGKTPERAWLAGILKHKVLDYFRRQTRERPANDDQALPSRPLLYRRSPRPPARYLTHGRPEDFHPTLLVSFNCR